MSVLSSIRITDLIYMLLCLYDNLLFVVLDLKSGDRMAIDLLQNGEGKSVQN